MEVFNFSVIQIYNINHCSLVERRKETKLRKSHISTVLKKKRNKIKKVTYIYSVKEKMKR